MKSSATEEKRTYDRTRQKKWRTGIGKEKRQKIWQRYLLNPGVRKKRSEATTRWRNQNPEKFKAYVSKNREKFNAYRRKRYKENKFVYERAKSHRSIPEVRSGINLKSRLRRIKNLESTRKKDRLQARKRLNLIRKCQVNLRAISHFISITLSKDSSVCYHCKKLTQTTNIHFDHIVPLSRGGIHAVENLCVSCSKCNLSKHSKLISEWVRLGQQVFPI